MNPQGKRDRSSAYVKDGDGLLLRDVELIRERWVRWFYTLLNPKSQKLDSNIAEGFYHRHDLCDSSATGVDAEETNSVVCMLY